jgi:putative FmdB family regulatory protein
MPIYEYACRACGHEFEREQRISDDPIKTCPSCKARQARRLISRTSFVLKGGGWYSDLYATPGDAKGKAEADDKPGAGAGASEAKPDAEKPAAPAESGKSKKPDKKAKGARSQKSAA